MTKYSFTEFIPVLGIVLLLLIFSMLLVSYFNIDLSDNNNANNVLTRKAVYENFISDEEKKKE